MTTEYVAMIRDCAARLAVAMRSAPNPREVYVFAVHTTAERNGALVVSADYPAPDLMPFEVIRAPNEPSGKWASVPYSSQGQRLMEACRSVPILPIHEV